MVVIVFVGIVLEVEVPIRLQRYPHIVSVSGLEPSIASEVPKIVRDDPLTLPVVHEWPGSFPRLELGLMEVISIVIIKDDCRAESTTLQRRRLPKLLLVDVLVRLTTKRIRTMFVTRVILNTA